MFILRRISGAGVQMNFALGKSYTYVSKEVNPEEFSRDFKLIHGEVNSADELRVYAFVSCESGEEIHSLYSNQQNYIMTDSGKTFSNITQK